MYCLFLGNFAYELGNFSVDKKNKFLMLSTNNKYIKMFKLKDLKENNEDICSCDDHDDDEVDHNPRKSISFFLQKMLVDTTQMHCRYRYDSKVDNLAMFDPERDDKFNIIESNGEVKVVNFNRKIFIQKICHKSKRIRGNEKCAKYVSIQNKIYVSTNS